MWLVTNQTPYAAERTWARDKTGEHHWIVAVRATFDILAEGALQLADEQPPPVMAPEYFGAPGGSSLRFDSDLGFKKPTTDLTINASAYAPRGKPAPAVNVKLTVGTIHKELVVHGARVYCQGATGMVISRAEPFVRLAIRYEQAYGGMDLRDPDPNKRRIDARNPVGKGVRARSADLADTPAHSVEYPTGDPAKVGPAGFGAIASYWSPRLELCGTYDESWQKSQRPLLPMDYDERCVLCSPADQRPPRHLRGGEPVELLNLTPEGVLRLVLPKVDLTYTTRINGRHQKHPGDLAAVIIEPDNARLVMVWQTSLVVRPTEVDYLDETVVEQRPCSP